MAGAPQGRHRKRGASAGALLSPVDPGGTKLRPAWSLRRPLGRIRGLPLVAAAVLVASCASPTPTVGGLLTQCASARYVGAFAGGADPETFDLYGLRSDGSFEPLTSDGRSFDPWLAGDGETLLYTRNDGTVTADAPTPPRQILVQDLVTRKKRVIVSADNVRAPSLSPDARTVAFTSTGLSERDKYGRISLVGLAPGSAPIPLAAANAGPNTSQELPRWRPQSQSLAYLSVQHGSANADLTYSVHIVDLKSNSDSIVYAAPVNAPIEDLTWNPDGARLLITVRSFDLEARPSVRAIELRVLRDQQRLGQPSTLVDPALGNTVYVDDVGDALIGIGEWGPSDQPSLVSWIRGEPAVVPVDLAFARQLVISPCRGD